MLIKESKLYFDSLHHFVLVFVLVLLLLLASSASLPPLTLYSSRFRSTPFPSFRPTKHLIHPNLISLFPNYDLSAHRRTDMDGKHSALWFQLLRRRATVRCRCRAVHNTSSTSAKLGNSRKHSAAGAVTSLDRGLLTHSTDNVLSSVLSTSPPQIWTVRSLICLLNDVYEYVYWDTLDQCWCA